MTREEAIEVYNGLINTKIKEAFEFFAPELAGSEDERVRKEIVSIVKAYRENCIDEGTHRFDDCLSWLEKQKEQKPWKVGANAYFTPEQKPAEWSEEDSVVLEDAITAVDLLGNDDKYKESHPNLAKAFRVAKDWLKSLPNRFTLQPKQEWSEEDEHRKTAAIYFLESAKKHYADTSEIEATIAWLKSLRPRWRPSEEQMITLIRAQSQCCPAFAKILQSIHDGLKKL